MRDLVNLSEKLNVNKQTKKKHQIKHKIFKKGKSLIKMLTRMSPCYNGLLRPLSVCVRTASNSSMTNVDELVAGDKDKKMSRAMRYYLQKRRNYEEFIGHHQAEFDIGKQHLANMMGVDSKTMTQKDIDEAIGEFAHLKIISGIDIIHSV